MTKDQKRYAALQKLGCICCRMLGFYSAPDIHHIVSGGKRKGNQYTLPLCSWHHRGVKPYPVVISVLRSIGPSLAGGSKPFVARWGTELELLDKVNQLIGSQRAKDVKL
jgi:RecA-dependent nuclease